MDDTQATIQKLKALFQEIELYRYSQIRLPHEPRQDIFEIVTQSLHPRISQFLIETVQQRSNLSVRTTAIEALGRIHDETAIEMLLDLLKNVDEDKEIRSEAAIALGNIGATVAVPALIENLRNKRNGRMVMWHCADALGIGRFNDPAVVDALINALIDDYSEIKDSSDIRDAATDALGTIGNDYTVRRLLDLLDHESLSPKDYIDISIRGDIISAMGKTKNPLCVDPLLKILNNPQTKDDLHASTLAALSNFNDPRIPPALKTALNSSDETIRIEAKIALGKLGYKVDE